MVRQRVRIRFRKQGDLRFVGHRDLVRSLERLFRRAGLALGMSQGFHPKPRMSFPSALAVGIEGLDEVMELELAEPQSAEELLSRLAAGAVRGLEFASAEVLPPGACKARLSGAIYRVPVPAARCPQTSDRVARLLSAASYPIVRAKRSTPLDLRRFLESLTLQDGVLQMRLRIDPEGSVGPRDVLAALELADLESEGLHLTRTAVELG
jgi:radical SAM-linked protein